MHVLCGTLCALNQYTLYSNRGAEKQRKKSNIKQITMRNSSNKNKNNSTQFIATIDVHVFDEIWEKNKREKKTHTQWWNLISHANNTYTQTQRLNNNYYLRSKISNTETATKQTNFKVFSNDNVLAYRLLADGEFKIVPYWYQFSIAVQTCGCVFSFHYYHCLLFLYANDLNAMWFDIHFHIAFPYCATVVVSLFQVSISCVCFFFFLNSVLCMTFSVYVDIALDFETNNKNKEQMICNDWLVARSIGAHYRFTNHPIYYTNLHFSFILSLFFLYFLYFSLPLRPVFTFCLFNSNKKKNNKSYGIHWKIFFTSNCRNSSSRRVQVDFAIRNVCICVFCYFLFFSSLRFPCLNVINLNQPIQYYLKYRFVNKSLLRKCCLIDNRKWTHDFKRETFMKYQQQLYSVYCLS